jgi:GNAT superfamily N-acetyltransferase
MLVRSLDVSRMIGPAAMLRVVPIWLLRRVFLVFVRDLDRPLPDVPPPHGVRWTRMTPADVPRVRALDPSVSAGEIQGRLAEGQACRLGWLDDELVHFRWYTRGDTYLPYLGATVRLGRGDLLCVVSFTHHAFRNRGVSSASMSEVFGEARRSGCTRALSLVAWWNTPSIVLHERLGATVAGRVARSMLRSAGAHTADGLVVVDEDGLRVRPAASGAAT